MKERTTENRLRLGIEAMGGRCLKLTIPGVAGAPDRLVLLPGGRLYFAELKKTTGRLEASQKVFFPVLERLGFPVHALYGNHEVDGFLNKVRGERETIQQD